MENKRCYKVLEVREYFAPFESANIPHRDTHFIVVICVDVETGQRKRLEFFKGRPTHILGKSTYLGYAGEYDKLVAGDVFYIEPTNTYATVYIVR